jgi:tellurite resistance protein
MTKDKDTDQKDIFLRGARLRARVDAEAREMHHDAGRAASEDYFGALVAAVAVIAHADGRLELAERRKLVEAFIASPAMKGFSVADLAQELAEHSRAYGYDPHSADQRALACISASTLSGQERQSIRQTCHDVITADGLVHPVELGALYRIERAMGIAGGAS